MKSVLKIIRWKEAGSKERVAEYLKLRHDHFLRVLNVTIPNLPYILEDAKQSQ
jgi:hypothetical protein